MPSTSHSSSPESGAPHPAGEPAPDAADTGGLESLELLRRTAALARLEITAEEAQRLAPQFETILASFEGLRSIDVAGMQPMTGPGQLCDILRADEPRPGLTREQALVNAPLVEDGCYGVPKTVGGA